MTNQKTELTEIILNEQGNFQRYVKHKIANISDMDAEDIVADVVFNLYNRIDIDFQVGNILAYAYRSVSNKIVDFIRQRKVAVSYDKPDKSSGLTLSEIIDDPDADIERKMQNEEFTVKIYSALLTLDSLQRAVWVATELEDYSFKELSEKWGEPIGTLLSRKSRASKTLKMKLKNLK